MNERLAELTQLWNKHFDAELSVAENARLAELMNDAPLMEAFAEAQAARTEAEPVTGLNGVQWAALDARVARAFRRSKLSRRMKPLAILLSAVFLGAAGLTWFGANSGHQRPDLSLEGESFSIEKKSPRKQAPAAAEPATDASHEVRAAKISVVVEQPKKSRASVEIFTNAGIPVRSLYSGELEPGKHRFEWNGLNDLGAKVKPGAYTIEIRSASGLEKRQLEIRKKK